VVESWDANPACRFAGAREPFSPHADGNIILRCRFAQWCWANSRDSTESLEERTRSRGQGMSGKAETRAGTDPRSAAQVGHQRGAEDLSLGIEEILHLILNVSAQCPETDFSKLIMMTLWHCCNEFFASKFTYARTMYERQINYLLLLVFLDISVRL
jgi:hypothetical protein